MHIYSPELQENTYFALAKTYMRYHKKSQSILRAEILFLVEEI